MDYAAIAATFNKMNLEQLREVNRLVVNQINHLHRQRAATALTRFRVGDLIEFVDDKRGRKVQARVTKLNQKTLNCHEISGLQMPWRVSPAMCRLVGA
jgi:hypothetical protein